MRQPIPFMFGSRVRFSGTADHFQLEQIQDGGQKTSNGHISAMHYPIHCMYVRRPYFALGL